MILKLHSQRLQTVEEIRAFLDGVTTFDFEPPSREEIYQWLGETLRQLGYRSLSKADRGVVKDFCEKVSGLSRAQVTRLIRQYRDRGRIRDRRGSPAKPFTRRYAEADIRVLAELDALHGTLSGPATRNPSWHFRGHGDRYLVD